LTTFKTIPKAPSHQDEQSDEFRRERARVQKYASTLPFESICRADGLQWEASKAVSSKATATKATNNRTKVATANKEATAVSKVDMTNSRVVMADKVDTISSKEAMVGSKADMADSREAMTNNREGLAASRRGSMGKLVERSSIVLMDRVELEGMVVVGCRTVSDFSSRRQ